MKVEVIKENDDFPVGLVGKLIEEEYGVYRVLVETWEGVPLKVTLAKSYSEKCEKSSHEIAVEKHLTMMMKKRQ